MKEPNTPQLLRVIPKPPFSLEKLGIYAIDLRKLLDNCLAFDLHYIPSNGIDRIESQQKRRPALHSEHTQINGWHLDPQ